MVQTIFVGLGALVMLIALAGFLRGLWASKSHRNAAASSSDWGQAWPETGHGHSGHGGDIGDGGH
ncbi:MAG TPA: hypothetical protein VM782_12845 [Stellaceae bacterium]|nr:hypothetical protein [Stellaceae bacterium]